MWQGLNPGWWPVVPWIVALAGSLFGAATDIRSRRIPNKLTGPMLAAGLLCQAIFAGWPGLGGGAAGMVLLAVPFLVFYAFGGGGAGDVKLMAAIGAWLGPKAGLGVLAAVLLWGGVLGIGYALLKKQLRSVARSIFVMLANLVVGAAAGTRPQPSPEEKPVEGEKSLRMPYGLAIFLGVCSAAWLAYRNISFW